MRALAFSNTPNLEPLQSLKSALKPRKIGLLDPGQFMLTNFCSEVGLFHPQGLHYDSVLSIQRRRALRTFLISVLLGCFAIAGACFWWVNHPVSLRQGLVDLSIEPGTSPREVAQVAAKAGIPLHPRLLYFWFRFSGDARLIRAGSYELEGQVSPRALLQKLVQGDEALRSVTLVEGWTFTQVRVALAKAEQLKPESAQLGNSELMQRLGREGVHPEGRFFPDTYTYSKGSTDLAVLQRAMRAMDTKLALAWSQRNPAVPLQSPDQVLILASIVEKETGRVADQPHISAVFNNRLLLGMRLQTDPTVIYGMGEAFDGNLRKNDLKSDTPYNTYTRSGLPPTPIAMPGRQALWAVTHPAATKALYFVARGDGTSAFSETLDEHNRAVNTYQRGK
jgi:UPF0755 protein